MAVRISGFQAVSNDLDLFREQLQDGLTVKEQLNAVTLHLNNESFCGNAPVAEMLSLRHLNETITNHLRYSMMSIRQEYLEKALHDVNSCDVELETMQLFQVIFQRFPTISQVWLCDTENAIGNGKNVSGLKNTVKLQLGKTVGDALVYMTEKLCATFTARRGDTATQRPWQSLQSCFENKKLNICGGNMERR
ncbi:hypothetical protein T12_13386 [Trichinella patagoniensis]|uniref:Uncharacterized protein n=1 Tax=Trichinella patagoniensis TaxID=990121 RepID=A0A0V0Z742_9BILA|nr:hypothetical protein T12_13386 [Trichinella patagoniensis]